MTKAEYLEKLQEKLQKFSNELQDEIMDDYLQHFAEGQQLGKSDEEIIEELGNIEDMIQELPKEEYAESLAVAGNDEAAGGTSASFTEIAIAEIAEKEAEKQYSYDGLYKGVVLDGKIASVFVAKSADGRLHVDYRNDSDLNGQLKYEFYQYEQDGIFYAGVKRREGVDSGAKKKTISFFGRTISFEGAVSWDNDADIQIFVQIPDGMEKVTIKTATGEIKAEGLHVGELNINSNSGDVSMRSLVADTFKFSTGSGDAVIVDGQFKSAAFNTASGDLEVRNVNSESLNVNSASGDLTVHSVKAGNLKMNTASGDMDMCDVEAESVVFNSASGDMSGERVYVLNSIQCTTASGDVELSGGAKNVKGGTASGDFSLKCDGPVESVNVNTGSGDVTLNLRGITGMEITTKVQSGDVDIDWMGHSACVQNATSAFGDGSSKVNVKTGSGDIEVRCS